MHKIIVPLLLSSAWLCGLTSCQHEPQPAELPAMLYVPLDSSSDTKSWLTFNIPPQLESYLEGKVQQQQDRGVWDFPTSAVPRNCMFVIKGKQYAWQGLDKLLIAGSNGDDKKVPLDAFFGEKKRFPLVDKYMSPRLFTDAPKPVDLDRLEQQYGKLLEYWNSQVK